MAPPTATLTVTATTPYSAQLRFESTVGGAWAYLKKSGATGGDIDLTSFAAGPLRACLTRSADWTTLTGKVIARMTIEGLLPVQLAQSFTVAGLAAVGTIMAWANNNVGFQSGAGAGNATIELRFLASNQR